MQLYNQYADQASYFDICLVLFEAAGHRNEADINATWQQLLDVTHQKVHQDASATQLPYEAIITMVKDMAHRLSLSENTFPASVLIPMLEQYAFEFQNNVGPRYWVIDLFIDVGFAYETILAILQGMWYNDMAPFVGKHKRILADHVLYVCEQWYEDCVRHNTRLYGGDDNAMEINGLLEVLTERGLQPDEQERAMDLRRKIQRSFR